MFDVEVLLVIGVLFAGFMLVMPVGIDYVFSGLFKSLDHLGFSFGGIFLTIFVLIVIFASISRRSVVQADI